MSRLGGTTIDLNPTTSQIGRGEPIKDTARVLSRYCDVIAIRTFDHSDLEEYAKWSTKPVINALTDLEHPCQALADFLTIHEEFLDFKDVVLTFIGDGNNVANSLILCGALLGVEVRIACPKGYEPNPFVIKKAFEIYQNKASFTFECGSSKQAEVVKRVLLNHFLVTPSKVIYNILAKRERTDEEQKITPGLFLRASVLASCGREYRPAVGWLTDTSFDSDPDDSITSEFKVPWILIQKKPKPFPVEDVVGPMPPEPGSWQKVYDFKDPKFVPAGTEMVFTGTFDNSEFNPSNPDASQTLSWGEQTWQEMFFGFYRYVEAGNPGGG